MNDATEERPAIYKITAEKFEGEWEITILYLNSRRVSTRFARFVDALEYASNAGKIAGEN